MVGLVTTDIDHDGDIDLITASADDRELRGSAKRRKREFTRKTTALSFTPTALIGADITGDGAIDMVLLDDTGSCVYMLANDGSGHFPDEADTSLATTNMPTQLTSVDFNLDGKMDVVLENVDFDGMTYQAAILLNDGQGLPMDNSMAEALIFSDFLTKPFLSTDIDGDMKPDLLLSVNAEAIHVFPSAGSTFQPQGLKVMPSCTVSWMGTGDLDGDGLIDLATGCADTASVQFLRQSPRLAFSTSPQAGAVVLPAAAMAPLLDAQLVDVNGDYACSYSGAHCRIRGRGKKRELTLFPKTSSIAVLPSATCG